MTPLSYFKNRAYFLRDDITYRAHPVKIHQHTNKIGPKSYAENQRFD